jgi:hypothetical protein
MVAVKQVGVQNKYLWSQEHDVLMLLSTAYEEFHWTHAPAYPDRSAPPRAGAIPGNQ